MEFLKTSRRKSLLSEALHAALNIALAVTVFTLVYVSKSIELAFALVILSKWRVLAVRPRYWWANILANIVDISVSLSTVLLLYLAGTSSAYALGLQVGVTTMYALWLVVVKPRAGPRWITFQAATGLFLGVWTLSAIAHTMPLWLEVLILYIIGYGAARHVLAARAESQLSLMSMVFGLVVAEIGWIAYHWTIAYGTVELGEFKISQVAIDILLISVIAERCYTAISEQRSLKSVEVVAPVLFAILLIIVLVAVFSSMGTGII